MMGLRLLKSLLIAAGALALFAFVANLVLGLVLWNWVWPRF